MKSKIAITMTIALCFAMLLMMIPAPTKANGPRTQYLRLQYYLSDTALYTGLKGDEIDLMGWPLTRAQYEDAITDPNIVVCPTIENGMFEFDFNNNYTLPDGSLNPMHVLAFRQAVALCVDKVSIITNICGGHALRLDTPLSSNPNYQYWWKEEVAYPNYPYEYNTAAAAALLDANGFTIKGGDTWRSWPNGDPLPELKFYIRTDHQPRRDMGHALKADLISIGINVGMYDGPSSFTYTPVMGNIDYHIYTGGWSIGVNPTVLYNLYHMKGWYAYGPNYVTGMDENNEPNYPDLDYWLEKLYYANDAAEALEAALESQNLMIDYCIDVWAYAAKGYYAYRNLLGVVNFKAYGTVNGYTFLNAYKASGDLTMIRMGTKSPPEAINMITSQWVWDWQHLDRTYETLTQKNPYDLGATGDQGSFAQDWKIETWVDPEDMATKTKLTFYLRTDITSTDGIPYTAYDVEWCLWYHYAIGWADWNFESIMDMKKTIVLDERTIEIYLNVKSMWALYFMNVPLLPKYVWNRTPLVEGPYPGDPVPHVHEWHVDEPILPGDDYIIPEMGVLPGIVIMKDGIPLIPGVDYRVEGIDVTGEYDFCYNRIIWLRPLALCQNIVFTYYVVGEWTGFFPGNLPANEILNGTGMYKYVSYNPTVYMLFERYDGYYLGGSPVPLGEIDWRYTFIAGLQPKDGYYQINIYDVVAVAGAYGSRGTAIPDPNWFAGADLAAPYGYINIYDVVTVTGKYGMKWGSPPPNPPPP